MKRSSFLIALLTDSALLAKALARSSVNRVSGEIHALSAALESYKADHGRYPTNAVTQALSPRLSFDSISYIPASCFLYRELSGDADGDPSTRSPEDKRCYFGFRPEMLRFLSSPQNTFIADPWGNSYGYSTHQATARASTAGYNLTFDLWSTGGKEIQKDQSKWWTNW